MSRKISNLIVRGLTILFAVSIAAHAQGQSLSIDAKVSKDNSSPSSTTTTPAFSTTSSKELLLAFVSSDAPQNGANTTVTGISGGGLTWQLVQRTNVQFGTAEVWRAFALVPLSNAKVTVTLSNSVASSVTVVSFIGADPSGINGSGAIGAVGTGNGSSGAPNASLVTTRNNSWVFGVGNDWDKAIARTLGANQTLVHQYLATVNDTYWVQSQTAPTSQSGTTVLINDTAPTTDRYNLSVVEVLPAQTPPPSGPLAIDTQVSNDKTPSKTNTTPALSTSGPNELLLAFVSSDSTSSPNTTVTGVAGGGLTFQLVQRTNVQLGTAEIWRAFAPTQLSNVTVTASLSQSVANSLTVVSFTGADPSGTNGSGAIGALGMGNSGRGAPTASLITTRNYSWVFAAGNDWNNGISRTTGANQSLVHQYLATVNDTYWVQAENSPTPQSGTTVTVNDTAPATDSYNLSLVEVLPAITSSPLQITASASPSPNGNGWNNTPVTVSFQCSGGVAPVQCPNQQVISTEGSHQVITGTATDAAGDKASASVTLNIDRTPPTLSITSPANGANLTSSAVAVSGSISDALSGVSSVSCNGSAAILQSGTYSCAINLNPGSNTISVQATDVAGNVSTQSVSVTLITAPNIGSFSPSSAPAGTLVTVNGSGFVQSGFTAQLTLNQQGGGTIIAPISAITASTLSFVIPSGATTGPIILSLDGLSGSSSSPLTVTSSSSFTVTAGPTSATLLDGETTTINVSLASSNGYSGLSSLSLSGLPSGVTASFQPSSITSGQSSVLTLTAPANQLPSSSQLTITASGVVQGIAESQSASVALTVAGAGSIAFQGRAAVTDPSHDSPLVGLTVRFLGLNYTGASTGCTTSTTTDSSGNFIFSSLPSACAGPQMVQYDPSTITSPPGSYSGVNLSYVLTPGQVTTPGLVIHLPRVDNAETVMVQQDSGSDQTLQFKSIPNLTITVYAGTTFTLPDGTQPNPFPLRVAEIPYEQIPDFMPPDPTEGPVFAMSIEPFDSSSNQPIAVSFPNRSNALPGSNMPLTSLNPTLGMMVPYGRGTVSGDGTQIIPDSDPKYRGHLYGISHFDWHFGLPPNSNTVNPTPDPGGPTSGDPVDPSSGLLVVNKTDIAFGGARGQLTVKRTYRSLSANVGPFGIGTEFNYDIRLNTTSVNGGLILLLMPDGNQFPFTGAAQSIGPFTNTTVPSLRGATITNLSCGIFGCSATLLWKNGTVYQFSPSQFEVSGASLLTSITDPNGNTTTVARNADATASVASVTDPVGRTLSFSYDESVRPPRIISITDPIGRTVQYTYNSPQATLATVTDVNGGITKYTYDTNNNLLTITDPRGITYLQNTYDANGRVIKQINGDGGVTAFSYTLLNPVASSTIIGNAVGITIPNVNTSPVVRTTVTDPLGNVTTYHFDPQGFLLDVTDALNEKTVYARQSGTEQLLSVTDPLGRTTAYTYDANGNTTSITRLFGTSNAVTSAFTYDPTFNKITSSTDPLGNTTKFTYDKTGNLTSVTDPLGNQSTFTYDPLGELATSTDPAGNATKFSYLNGDLAGTTDPLQRITTRSTDAVSRLLSVTDPSGITSHYQYSPLNQITQITDAAGNNTLFNYDSNGNLLSLTDANQHTTNYVYDSMDRLQTRTDPLGHSESYQYDLDGNLTQFTDRRGKISAYTYDPLNRRVSASFGPGESSIAYSYDGVGRLAQAVDSSSGTIARNYDGLDRLVQEITPYGSIGYGYDAAGRRTAMQVAGQPAVSYAYDNDSRLAQIVQGNSTVSFAYDADSRRASVTLPNSVVMSYGYDGGSQLSGVNYQFGNTTLGNLAYSYDLSGRRTAVGGSFARTGMPQAVASASYNANNQQTQFGSANLSYDANGNLTSDGANTYTWNARNQLVTISGGVSANFTYDPFGRRTVKWVGIGATNYVYDGVNPVQEQSAGVPVANLLAGLGIDEYFQRIDATGSATFLTDALGSTVALTSPNGSTLTSYTYEQFGNTSVVGTSASTYQFTGRENDGTGLYYYRARYYSAKLGRFLSEDPIGVFGRSVNLYQYARSSPTVFFDPLGLSPKPAQPCDPDGYHDAGPDDAAVVLQEAQSYEGTPYSLNGQQSNYDATDCSGLVYNAVVNSGIDPNVTYSVANDIATNSGYRALGDGEQPMSGDVVVFPVPGGHGHTGFYTGPGSIYSATSHGVRNGSFDWFNQGGTIDPQFYRVRVPCAQ